MWRRLSETHAQIHAHWGVLLHPNTAEYHKVSCQRIAQAVNRGWGTHRRMARGRDMVARGRREVASPKDIPGVV